MSTFIWISWASDVWIPDNSLEHPGFKCKELDKKKGTYGKKRTLKTKIQQMVTSNLNSRPQYNKQHEEILDKRSKMIFPKTTKRLNLWVVSINIELFQSPLSQLWIIFMGQSIKFFIKFTSIKNIAFEGQFFIKHKTFVGGKNIIN